MLDHMLDAREASGRPIRVAMIGAGAAARMIGLQLLTSAPGMRLVAVANRTAARAHAIFASAQIEATSADTLTAFEDQVAAGRPVVTEDAALACDAANVDVIVEVTGSAEFGASVASRAIAHHKHLVLVNVELDCLLGPILKYKADRAGVVVTNTDGDEPGVAMTLLRYVRSVGLRPVAAGNLKGMLDRYRTPDTQRAFAAQHDMDAFKVSSFADGTKLSMETAVLANASGFRVGQPGMYGPRCAHVKEISRLLPADQLLDTGLVDYALGAEPHTGAFVVVYEDHPAKQRELAYYKMGDGPFYVFYTPFHLPHVQIVSTIARAALAHDATVAPIGAPVCEVAAVAKRELHEGAVLDGVGGFDCYGLIYNADAFAAQRLLPISLSAGCRLRHPVARDRPLSYADVTLPAGRLVDQLRAEQQARLPVATAAPAAIG